MYRKMGGLYRLSCSRIHGEGGHEKIVAELAFGCIFQQYRQVANFLLAKVKYIF